MRASEKMAERVRLCGRLAEVDDELRQGWDQSYRSSAAVRDLLGTRRTICTEMVAVGYVPWQMPVDAEEAKAL